MYLYVAAKPVRFDRDYAVGEIIPNEAINLATVGRMMTFGRVARIDPDTLPEGPAESDGAYALDGLNSLINTDEPEAPGPPETPAPPETPGFICAVCGRVFSTKSALSNHSKTHASA